MIDPLGIWRGSPDTIWVLISVLRRTSLLTAEGTFLRTLPMPEVSWDDRWRVDQPDIVGPDGVALTLARYAPGTTTWDDGFPLLRFTLAQGEVLGEVARVERTAAVQIRWQGDVFATGSHPMPDPPIISNSPDDRLVRSPTEQRIEATALPTCGSLSSRRTPTPCGSDRSRPPSSRSLGRRPAPSGASGSARCSASPSSRVAWTLTRPGEPTASWYRSRRTGPGRGRPGEPRRAGPVPLERRPVTGKAGIGDRARGRARYVVRDTGGQ